MKKILLVVFVVIMISGLVACAQPSPTPKPTPSPAPAPQQAPAYTWRLQSFMPPADDLFGIYLNVNFVDKIKDATGGKVKITAYPGGALVPPTEILKSTANGTVEMGYTQAGYHAGFIPVTAVADGLPLSFRGYADVLELYRNRGLGDILRKEYAKNGVYLLTVMCSEPLVILSRKPLEKKSDFEGAKIRGFGPWNKFFGLLGASPVDMPLKDVYLALSMNTIDGTFTGVNPHYQLKHYEVCKYGTWPALIGSSIHDVYINLDTWNKLPADLKKTIETAASEWTDDSSKKWEQFSVKSKANLEAGGVKWLASDRDWMIEKAQGMWTEAGAKDTASAQAIEIMTKYLKEVGAMK